jgi:hypothetical protein
MRNSRSEGLRNFPERTDRDRSPDRSMPAIPLLRNIQPSGGAQDRCAPGLRYIASGRHAVHFAAASAAPSVRDGPWLNLVARLTK